MFRFPLAQAALAALAAAARQAVPGPQGKETLEVISQAAARQQALAAAARRVGVPRLESAQISAAREAGPPQSKASLWPLAVAAARRQVEPEAQAALAAVREALVQPRAVLREASAAAAAAAGPLAPGQTVTRASFTFIGNMVARTPIAARHPVPGIRIQSIPMQIGPAHRIQIIATADNGEFMGSFIADLTQSRVATGTHLFVQPEARRSNIGSALIFTALDVAANAGRTGFTVLIERGNAGAEAFYRALNFACVFQFPDGNALWHLNLGN